MHLEIHNYIWSRERLVQIESQPSHIDGVLDILQDVRRSSNLDWEDIYSAHYECEEDGTITFYEGESAEAGNPGVWTYVVYDCPEGSEEVVINPSIDVLAALLKVKRGIQEGKTSKAKLIQYLNTGHLRCNMSPTITTAKFQVTVPPFRWDEAGGIRIGSSRVTLDSILAAYHNGSTPEEIAIQFSVLRLEDIYSAIAYYLNHRQEIDSYLEQRNQQAQQLRQQLAQNHNLVGLRQRLLDRHHSQKESRQSASSN